MNWLVLSLFLYFPEDKSEYLPAALWIIAAFVAAIFVMRLFIKISQKEAQKAAETEQEIGKKDEN
ncbi:hypothetical protein SAMN05192533_10460 [Mesobacillus persicus]|uniref:Uncharacterized protein n=1 Tax=Mesobacillus persicus TaxID=930146 RepID=A0A1H7ZTF3_9BACI|nr:hypothetical protein [Mesobacillus persicus]SEM61074.1 hypothetical protein SAMN05192533_10460 [Mesobacillus persicus]